MEEGERRVETPAHGAQSSELTLRRTPLRTLLTYPDSKELEYTCDEAGNLETVTA